MIVSHKKVRTFQKVLYTTIIKIERGKGMKIIIINGSYRKNGATALILHEIYVEILYFRQFYRHFVFTEDGDGNRNKRMEKYFEVSVVADMGCGGSKDL